MAELLTQHAKQGTPTGESDLLNLRVNAVTAEEFRIEAVRRHLRQNALFEEMWRIYQEVSHVRA